MPVAGGWGMPRKMIRPSPGVSILSVNSLKPLPTPSEAILLSINRFEDCASVRCASRIQTASVPRSAWQVSTSSSPKNAIFRTAAAVNPFVARGRQERLEDLRCGDFQDRQWYDLFDESASALPAVDAQRI